MEPAGNSLQQDAGSCVSEGSVFATRRATVLCRLGMLPGHAATETGSRISVEMLGPQGSRADTAALGLLEHQTSGGDQKGLTHGYPQQRLTVQRPDGTKGTKQAASQSSFSCITEAAKQEPNRPFEVRLWKSDVSPYEREPQFSRQSALNGRGASALESEPFNGTQTHTVNLSWAICQRTVLCEGKIHRLFRA